MKFCSCGYYLYLKMDKDSLSCIRECKNCGYIEAEKEGALISETLIKERASEGYKIVLNEFTRQDPTLPHLHTMKCPRAECKSNVGGVAKDVIYIKYDPANLKYLYICNVCEEHWRSRS
jgi:DNA-directed RNA polymerase subunit M/transcription elongation factor TFIIS